MHFWKIFSYSVFGFLLNEAILCTSAAPVGGSGSCELRLQYFKQDVERQLIYFDVVTREGTPINTTFRYCKLADAKTSSFAEAERKEFPFRLERRTSPFDHLLKVVFVVDGVSFLRNRGRLGSFITLDLLCDDLDVKCIKLHQSELDHSETFVRRKLLSMTAGDYLVEADPFLAVIIASAGVVLVIVVLGLCASCNGKEERSLPVEQNAQLVGVSAIKSVEENEPHVQAQETKTVNEVTESRVKTDFAQNSNHMNEATTAVEEPTSLTPLQRLSGEISHEKLATPTASDEVFAKENQLGVKGQKVKDAKGRKSSSVSSDRSSRSSTKFDDERKIEKGVKETLEHKDDKHDKHEKHHIGEKFHGLKKKLSIKSGKGSLSRENINEIDGKTKEKERESSKKDKKSHSDKVKNSKDHTVEAEHRSRCPTPPHDRTSRELPKLPFESDPSNSGSSSSGRPLPQRNALSEPAAVIENVSYECVDESLRSRSVHAVSVGEIDTLYETVETKKKENAHVQPPVRTSSGASQQYEAVDFVELKRVAMQNQAAKNADDEYTEVPETVKSHINKIQIDDKTSISSTDDDFYTLVKDDSGTVPVPDMYAEVTRKGLDKEKQTGPVSTADLLYEEPDKPLKGVVADISEKQIKEHPIPAPPSVDSLRSVSVSGRSLSESDSSPDTEPLVVRSQSDSKAQVFHRETDPKKLEEMYSKVDFALKKRHSGIAIESGSSDTVKVFHRQEDDDNENQLDDENYDDGNPPPVPFSLYAPIPTVDESGRTSADQENESLTLQGTRERAVSKTSLTYEEIGRNLTEEKQTEESVSNWASDFKNPNNNNRLMVEMASASGNRMSTGSEAYEEVTPMNKPEPDCNDRTSSNVLVVKLVNVKKEGSYEDVSPQGDIHVGCSDDVNRTSTGNSYKTTQPDKFEVVNGNCEITKPRSDGERTSAYYETLENMDIVPSGSLVGKSGTASIPSEPDNSSLTESKDGASLYEEVVVRKEEKKTKKSRLSTSKMKTLAQI